MDRKELEEKSGISHRTIRYLITEGIVPPPNGAGRGASYDESHLTALKRYKHLVSEGVTSIAAIRKKIAEETVVNRVLELSPGLELVFKNPRISFEAFVLNPIVLKALETLKIEFERN